SSSSAPYDPPQSTTTSKTAQLQQQVNDVVGIMQDNIDAVQQRGETLDSMNDKTAQLEQGAGEFRRGASRIRRQMWWKNAKWTIFIGLGVAIILVIIIVSIIKTK
ncbi:hypothetical protein BGZ98_002556, partial [Dissophora globulifera]